jgi:hypothetical protein
MTEENQIAEPAQARGVRNSRKGDSDWRDPAKRRRPGQRRSRFDAQIPEHLVGRWVLDEPGRVQTFIEKGWMFAVEGRDALSEDSDRKFAIHIPHASTNKGGESVKQYLMLLPKELYDEDRGAMFGRLDEITEEMERGEFASGLGRNGYVASEGVTVPKGKG